MGDAWSQLTLWLAEPRKPPMDMQVLGPTQTIKRKAVTAEPPNIYFMATGLVYRRLRVGEIRVLSPLSRSEGNKDLPRWSMEQISLPAKSSQPYYAVSYVWGDVSQQRLININDTVVSIPFNASIVLERFQDLSSQSQTAIWIDAICINQSDLAEKAQQVSAMGSVYRGAETVLIWLGESDDQTVAAMQSIQLLVKQAREASQHGQSSLMKLLRKQEPSGSVTRLYSDESLPDGIDWPALQSLYQAPWFCRLWILQEATLARRAICHVGAYTIELGDITLAAAWLEHRRYANSRRYGIRNLLGVQNASRIFDLGTEPASLSFFLQISTSFECADPRDKAYGLLGLLQPPENEAFRKLMNVSYTKSVRQVFVDATRAAILETGDLTLLAYASACIPRAGTNDSRYNLPSWVPCYDIGREFNSAAHIPIFSNSVISRRYQWFEDDLDQPIDDILSVEGVVTGQVEQTWDPLRLLEGTTAPLEEVLRLWQDIVEIFATSVKEAARVLAVTLTGGKGADNNFANPFEPQLHADFHAFLVYCAWCSEIPTPESVDAIRLNDVQGDAQRFYETMWHTCLNRSVFLTDAKILGMGPPNTKAGDKVCILHGAMVPFILRSDQACWNVIGDAYVYGLMDAQYFAKLQSEGHIPDDSSVMILR